MTEKEIQPIIDEYYPKVKKWVAMRLPDRPSSHADLVQEIMTALFENLKNDKFQKRSQIGTYVCSITKNKIKDFFKHQRTRKGTKSLDDENTARKHEFDRIRTPDDIEQQIENKERALVLKEIVGSIDPRYREVIQLYYNEHLKMDEIAEFLGITVKQAHNYKSYALKLLGDHCRNHPKFPEIFEMILLFIMWHSTPFYHSISSK